MRYLMPLPVPQRWRRRMMALGSGDPTRIICSALIAQAFEHVRYPILPKITRAGSRNARREILQIRHSSLYTPRDFDISPYFEMVKPTIVRGFDYLSLHWADKPKPLTEAARALDPFQVGARRSVVYSCAAWLSRAGRRNNCRRKLLAAAAIRNGGRGTCPQRAGATALCARRNIRPGGRAGPGPQMAS